jgi:CheY-like chemotaxis protein
VAEILLIDDMAAVRRALGLILVEAGHNVTPAPDGAVALRLLQEQRFDLVITDMLMPEVDGRGVMFFLNALERRPGVIAISGGGPDVVRSVQLHLAELETDAFLDKPVEKTELLAAVDRVLARRAPGAPEAG